MAAERVVKLPDGAGAAKLQRRVVKGTFQDASGGVSAAVVEAATGGPVGHAVPCRAALHAQLKFGVVAAHSGQEMRGEENVRVE